MSAEATTIFGYPDYILRSLYQGVCILLCECAQINLVGAEIKIILVRAYKQLVKQWLRRLYEILP